jgi:hypothetical protein
MEHISTWGIFWIVLGITTVVGYVAKAWRDSSIAKHTKKEPTKDDNW